MIGSLWHSGSFNSFNTINSTQQIALRNQRMIPITTQRRVQKSRYCGSILMMVLVAIIIMTLTTSTFLLMMRNEHVAARYSGSRLQAEMLSQSGVDYLRVLLAQTPTEIEQQGGVFRNPGLFQDVLVAEGTMSSDNGRFSVVAPGASQAEYQNVRFGLENESAKLNLNTLLDDKSTLSTASSAASSTAPSTASSAVPDEGETMAPRDRLLLIPGMNEAVADAILDWMDEDDSPRDFGAESSYYQSLTPAYQPRNGPLTQLGDLLMIQGVTTELLYGLDTNRNYTVEDDELPRGALKEIDNANGELNRGLSTYLTVHSLEQNVNATGEAKINLNDPLLESLHRELQQAVGAAEANFLIAYRQYGPMSEQSGDASSLQPSNGVGASSNSNEDEDTNAEVVSASVVIPNFKKEGETSIESVLDLIDARVLVKEEEDKPGQIIESPWKDDPGSYRQKFAELLDEVTTDTGERIVGRININQASQPVLQTIPGITEILAEQILANRDSTASAVSGDQRHPTWLLAEGLVTLDEFKPMLKYMTTGGDVFSGQVVGYFDAGTARSRTEVLLDRSGEQTRLLGWQDLSPLGPGFSRTLLSAIVDPDE